jgi:hypothetical protein
MALLDRTPLILFEDDRFERQLERRAQAGDQSAMNRLVHERTRGTRSEVAFIMNKFQVIHHEGERWTGTLTAARRAGAAHLAKESEIRGTKFDPKSEHSKASVDHYLASHLQPVEHVKGIRVPFDRPHMEANQAAKVLGLEGEARNNRNLDKPGRGHYTMRHSDGEVAHRRVNAFKETLSRLKAGRVASHTVSVNHPDYGNSHSLRVEIRSGNATRRADYKPEDHAAHTTHDAGADIYGPEDD